MKREAGWELTALTMHSLLLQHQLLWLITISNATLHYCKKGYGNSGSVEPQKRKCFNGNVCKVLCCTPHLRWIFWGCTCSHLLYIEEQVPQCSVYVFWTCALAVSPFSKYSEEGGVVHLVVFCLAAASVWSAAVTPNWWNLRTHIYFSVSWR